MPLSALPLLAVGAGLSLILAGCGGGGTNLPTPGSNQGTLGGGNGGNAGPQVNNNTIVFVSTRDGNPEIYSAKFDGTDARRLTNNAAIDENPSRTTDGRTIVFSSRRDGNSEIYKMNADGSSLVRLTQDAANGPEDTRPVFSPDGSKIVWQSTRAVVFGDQPAPRLYIMDASGANQRPVLLSDANQLPTDGSWNPDNTRLLGFLANPNDANNNDLAVITPDNGATAGSASIIRAGANASHARYSSGGARIVLSQGATGAGQLQLLNNDGSLIGAGPSGGVNQLNPSFSPNGNSLVWDAAPTSGAGRQLFVANLTNTGAQAAGTAITTDAQGENYQASWTQ